MRVREFSCFVATFFAVVAVSFIVLALFDKELSGTGLTIIIGGAALLAGFVGAGVSEVLSRDDES